MRLITTFPDFASAIFVHISSKKYHKVIVAKSIDIFVKLLTLAITILLYLSCEAQGINLFMQLLLLLDFQSKLSYQTSA